MKITVILMAIGAFWTFQKVLEKEREELKIGGQNETIGTTAFLRSAKILRRVQKNWGDLLSLRR